MPSQFVTNAQMADGNLGYDPANPWNESLFGSSNSSNEWNNAVPNLESMLDKMNGMPVLANTVAAANGHPKRSLGAEGYYEATGLWPLGYDPSTIPYADQHYMNMSDIPSVFSGQTAKTSWFDVLQEYMQKYVDAVNLSTERANQNAMASAQAQWDFNSREAALAREWSERMSNTSYQRAVQDLEKAGLSKILAYANGGASVPGAASASGSAAQTYNYSDDQAKAMKVIGIIKVIASFVEEIFPGLFK